MDAARSPESRVRTKLTTRTVRPTSAASHSLRNRNDSIVGNYENEAGRAGSRSRVICGQHTNPTASLACSQHAPHSTSSHDDGQVRRAAQAASQQAKPAKPNLPSQTCAEARQGPRKARVTSAHLAA